MPLKNNTTTLAKNPEAAAIQNNLADPVVSPFLGVQLSNFALGPAGITLDANYLFAGLFTGEYQALSFKFNTSVPFAELERVKLMFNVGVRDTLLILKQGGVENHLSAILGFGVENVIR